jgi:DNA-binding NtrC family response regulator
MRFQDEFIRIMIVDDEDSIIFSLKKLLKNYNLTCFKYASDAIESLTQGDKYDVLLIDFKLQSLTGLDILLEAKKRLDNYQALLITAFAEKDLLEMAINYDLIDKVVEKPFDSSDLISKIKSAIDLIKKREDENKKALLIKEELETLKTSININIKEKSFVFKSKTMSRVVVESYKIAQSSAPVVITGESGVGKDVIANLIHDKSPRSKNPFIRINCAAIPENLFEAEFFGSKKGSFTGSIKDTLGKFAIADKGTIFLDEISEVPYSQQAKLLRVIDNGEVYPIGSDTPSKIDVRIICATNRDLLEMVKRNEFRTDLYHRISVLSINVPSLKNRVEDIRPLSLFFLKEINMKEGGLQKYLDDNAIKYLEEIDIKGNVRELRNIIYKGYFKSLSNRITLSDIIVSEKKRLKDYFLNLEMTLSEFKKMVEKEYILIQLDKNGSSVTNTAKVLGMQISNLSRKLKEYGINTK